MPTWYTKFIDKLLNVFSNEGNGAFLMNKIKPDAYNIQLFVGDSIDMNLNFKVASDMFALQRNGHQTSSAPQQEPILICPKGRWVNSDKFGISKFVTFQKTAYFPPSLRVRWS